LGIHFDASQVTQSGDVSFGVFNDEEIAEILGIDDVEYFGNVIDIDVTFEMEDGEFIVICLPFNPAEIANPVILHFDGEQWNELATITIDEELGLICAAYDPADGFSPFVVGSGSDDSSLFSDNDDHG
jgi:hypothetical protein